MSPLSPYLFNHLESLVFATPFFPRFATLSLSLSGFSRTLLIALGNPTIAITGNETEENSFIRLLHSDKCTLLINLLPITMGKTNSWKKVIKTYEESLFRLLCQVPLRICCTLL